MAGASQYAMFGGPPPDITQLNSFFAFLLMMISPALTMRLVADENRSGTIELMLTSPVSDFEMVAGKWLGGLLFVMTLIGVTLIYPIILNSLVDPGIDQTVAMTSYLGLILIAASFLALGTGISAMFSNQLTAFFVSFVVFLSLWWLIGLPADLISKGGEFMRYLVITNHYDYSFNTGSINLNDLIYFFSLIATGLFTGTMALESRRWR
jgi:ABC-2 type transport system permease protein